MHRRSLLKLAGTAALATSLAPVTANARIVGPGISVRWLGAAMLEVDLGGVRFLTDPCYGEGPEAFQMGDPNEMFDLSKGPTVKMHARLTPFPGTALRDYDAVLLSHAHEDHFDQKAQSIIAGQGPVICSAFDATILKGKGVASEPLAHGQTREFTRGSTRVRVTAIPAIHSQAPGVSDILGMGNGYWIEATLNGRTRHIYWAGDTFMTGPVWAALEKRPTPDLFIPHIGAVGTTGPLGQLSMNGQEAVDFSERLKAERVLPIHHSTYELYLEPVSKMVEAHRASRAVSELNVLNEGAVLNL